MNVGNAKKKRVIEVLIVIALILSALGIATSLERSLYYSRDFGANELTGTCAQNFALLVLVENVTLPQNAELNVVPPYDQHYCVDVHYSKHLSVLGVTLIEVPRIAGVKVFYPDTLPLKGSSTVTVWQVLHHPPEMKVS
jgi:hypothetical protein